MKMLELPKLLETQEWSGYLYDDIVAFFKESGHDSEFRNWFSGKTGGMHEGKYYVYKHDFDRFCLLIGLSIG